MGVGSSSGKLSFVPQGGLCPGEKVKVGVNKQRLQILQKGHGGYNEEMDYILDRHLLLECFDKDGDAMVSYNNGRGFYINSQALQRVGEREELQICCGDRVQITVDDKQHTGLHWLDEEPASVGCSSLVGCKGVVFNVEGPFIHTALILPNGTVHRANCFKENLKWVKNPVLEIGDQVKVLDHMQTVMHMQEGHGSYTEAMELILGRTGHVINYRPFVGCKVEFQLVGNKVDFMINSSLLEKVSEEIEYMTGDKVKVTIDLHRFEANQSFHGGWNENMARFAGKVGVVAEIRRGVTVENESHGDLGLRFFGVADQIVVNPRSVTKFVETFKSGDDVSFVLDSTAMTKLTRKLSSYTTSNLANKQNQSGKVSSVNGSGENATVTVKYAADGKSVPFHSSHLVRALHLPSSSSSSSAPAGPPTLAREPTVATLARAQSSSSDSSLEPRNGLYPGDYVTCSEDPETMQLMQEEYGGWNDRMAGIIGSVSVVKGFNGNGGVVISGRGDDNVGDEWHVYAGALTRVEGDSVIIGVGDHVKIASQDGGDSDSSSEGITLYDKRGVVRKCHGSGEDFTVVVRSGDMTTTCEQISFDRLKKCMQPVIMVGDEVMIVNDTELVQTLQEEVKLPIPSNLSLLLGKKGKVTKITTMVDIAVRFSLSQGVVSEVFLNARLLFKVASRQPFRLGDKVEVSESLASFKGLQKEHGGWNESMSDLVEETGTVVKIFTDSTRGHKKDDLVVLFPQAKEPFVINPAAVKLHNDNSFDEDDDVVCVLPIELMKVVLPRGHMMRGFHQLKQKIFEKGEVTSVEGEGEYALVGVKYDDGVEMEYFAKHLHQWPCSGEQVAHMLLDALNTFMAFQISASENENESNETEEDSSAATSPTHSTAQVRECPLCFESEDVQWVSFRCGHLLCQDCAEKILNLSSAPGHRRCHLCKEPVDEFIRLYL